MSMISAQINHPDNSDGRGYHLNLPEKDSRITDCLRRFELPDVSTEKNCLMKDVYLVGAPFPLLDGRQCNLDELNYLAKRLDSLHRAVARRFEAYPAEELPNLSGALFSPPQKPPAQTMLPSSSILPLIFTATR